VRTVGSVLSIGVTVTVVGLAVFFEALRTFEDLVVAQTLLFTFFVVSEMAVIQVIRRRFGSSPFSNRWLVGAVITSLALQGLVLYTAAADLFDVVAPDVPGWTRIGVGVAVVFAVTYVLSVVMDRLLE
jgi:Ca2+-transporting ATPase